MQLVTNQEINLSQISIQDHDDLFQSSDKRLELIGQLILKKYKNPNNTELFIKSAERDIPTGDEILMEDRHLIEWVCDQDHRFKFLLVEFNNKWNRTQSADRIAVFPLDKSETVHQQLIDQLPNLL